VGDLAGVPFWNAPPGASGGGSGDVVGPASSTDNAIVRFDGTTGKAVQNSTVTISDAGVLFVVTAGTRADPTLVIGNAGVGLYQGSQVAMQFGINDTNPLSVFEDGVMARSIVPFNWSAGNPDTNSADTGLSRAAAGIVAVGTGAAGDGTGAIQLAERTAPAGTANAGRIYAQDNGSGKTQLMVIFGSGAAQQIAIEP